MSRVAPLAGRRIVLTRPAEQSAQLAARVAELGGEPVIWPLIRIAPVEDAAGLDACLRELDRFDWIALTSANAARAVLDRLAALGLPARALARTRVACVGPRTAEAVREAGIEADLIPERADGLGLAAALAAVAPPGARVLLPRSDRAEPDLPEALRRSGLQPVEVLAYRTVPVEVPPDDPVRRAVLAGEVDAVLLASGSAAGALAAALGPELEPWAVRPAGAGRPLVACIGRPTAAAARRGGLPVDVLPARPDGEELVRAVARALAGEGRDAR